MRRGRFYDWRDRYSRQTAAAPPPSGPTFLSSTAYPDAGSGSATFTPFTGLDLSNCDVALVWVVTAGMNSAATLATASTGWTKVGQRNWTVTINPTASISLFQKAAPTASEQLVVTGAGNGSARYGAVLERVDAADTVIWNGGTAVSTAQTNLDPASYDTGTSRAYLFTAAAAFQSVDASAGPSGYSNFTSQNGQGGTTSSIAIATLVATAQTENPGAFTNASSKGATAVSACYLNDQFAAWPSLIGAEMMVNGDCSSATGWSLPASFVIAAGKMTVTTSNAAATNDGAPNTAFIDGATYRNVFTIDTVSLGSVAVHIGDTTGTSRSTAATFSQDLIAAGTAGGDGWYIQALGPATMQLDNFSVKSIGLMGVEADWAFSAGDVFWSSPDVRFEGAPTGRTASLDGASVTLFDAAVSNSTACSVTISTTEYGGGSVEISLKGGSFVNMVANADGDFTKTITSGAGSGFIMRSVGTTEFNIIRVQIALA